MFNRFLTKYSATLGKYFRFFCILVLPVLVLYVTWIIFFMPHRLPLDGFMIGLWIFLVVGVVFQMSLLHWSRQRRYKPEYEFWAAAFYLSVLGVLGYFFLQILSDWIGFNVLNYLTI